MCLVHTNVVPIVDIVLYTFKVCNEEKMDENCAEGRQGASLSYY
jgi:hypothetical protein